MDGLILLVAIVALYFVPTIIAASRKHHNTAAIFLLNFFLGWTVLGWIVSIVWSATAIAPSTVTPGASPAGRQHRTQTEPSERQTEPRTDDVSPPVDSQWEAIPKEARFAMLGGLALVLALSAGFWISLNDQGERPSVSDARSETGQEGDADLHAGVCRPAVIEARDLLDRAVQESWRYGNEATVVEGEAVTGMVIC